MTIFSNILDMIGNKDIGRKLFGSSKSPVLSIGTTSACFRM